MWLPILDLTDELEALEFSEELETLDITGELELLALEEGQNDLARELEAIESGFWRTAEAEHPFLTGELPVIAEPHAAAPAVVAAARAPSFRPAWFRPVVVPPGVAKTAAPVFAPAPAPVARAADIPGLGHTEPIIPEAYTNLRPNRPAIVHRKRTIRLRRRLIVAVLVVFVAARRSRCHHPRARWYPPSPRRHRLHRRPGQHRRHPRRHRERSAGRERRGVARR